MALARRLQGLGASTVRASLARTAHLLAGEGGGEVDAQALSAPVDADYGQALEATSWGPAQRLRPPVEVAGAAMRWSRPACALGTAPAAW